MSGQAPALADKARETNYDLLRVLCTAAVICIHVGVEYKNAATDASWFGVLYTQHWLAICLYDVLPRFAVPCFVMLSGAFLLADDRNASYRVFYRKALCGVGIQTVVFSGLYFCYYELTAPLSILIWHQSLTRLFAPIRDLLEGHPGYHMWYLYMMAGVYLTVPVFVRVRQEIGEKVFSRLAWILFAVASVSGATSVFKLSWSIGQSACYLGYFLLGYVLRKGAGKADNRQGIFLISCGLLVEALPVLLWWKMAPGAARGEACPIGTSPFSPLILLASVLIFVGFSKIRVRRHNGLEKLAKRTFYIYLFHIFVWSILKKGIEVTWGALADCRIVIPACIVLVFAISYGLSLLYEKIWALANKDGRLTNRLCALVGLA